MVCHLGEQEEKVKEGPSSPGDELKMFIRKAIGDELSQGNRNFLLDLASVEWIDSTYVGMILSWHQQVAAQDGEFVLVNLSNRSKDIMKVAKLDSVLKVFNTPAEAQQYFTRPSS